MSPCLYIVIPCYNEEEVLAETAKRTLEKIEDLKQKGEISEASKICFVDDGSRDATWSIIESLNKQNPVFCGVKLAHNKGHQNALLAGLMHAKELADITISMDADLQDDINVIDSFVSEYKKGNEIVYGVRSSREKDTFFKRFTAESFYKVMKAFGAEIVFNHADYRLMSKKALEALGGYSEVNLFLRGIIPLLGFNTSTVEYERNERFAGESKYPLKKMIKFAFEGLTSFSTSLIRSITLLGFLIFLVSIAVMIYTIIRKFTGNTVDGWAALSCSIWLLGGIQLLSLGLVGEYIGKIYSETKRRPRFIIEKIL